MKSPYRKYVITKLKNGGNNIKSFKKLLSLVLSIVAITSFSTSAFANVITRDTSVDYIDVQYENYINTYEYNNPLATQSSVPRTSSLSLSEYPSGSYFNDFGDTPCTCHYADCSLDGSCDCKGYAGGIQCFAFAHYVFQQYNGETCNANNANGELTNITATSLENYLKDLPIGTHVRYKGASFPHSFIIMDHTSNGIKVYETNWKAGCEVGTRTVTYSTLSNQIKSITNSWS